MKSILFVMVGLLAFRQSPAQEFTIRVGQKAPSFRLPALSGDSVSLDDYRGKLILLDFWASWCAPCVKEQPDLRALYHQFGDQVKKQKFDIIGISLDKKRENWVSAVEKLQIVWPQASDLQFWRSPVAALYKVEELPFNVIVDEGGKILSINLHGKALQSFIQQHFDEQ